jgi:hypothetical protein
MCYHFWVVGDQSSRGEIRVSKQVLGKLHKNTPTSGSKSKADGTAASPEFDWVPFSTLLLHRKQYAEQNPELYA